MTDIAARLRKPSFMPSLAERREAADEIDRLKALIDWASIERLIDDKAEIDRLNEELRAVLGHVAELRAEIERLRRGAA